MIGNLIWRATRGCMKRSQGNYEQRKMQKPQRKADIRVQLCQPLIPPSVLRILSVINYRISHIFNRSCCWLRHFNQRTLSRIWLGADQGDRLSGIQPLLELLHLQVDPHVQNSQKHKWDNSLAENNKILHFT